MAARKNAAKRATKTAGQTRQEHIERVTHKAAPATRAARKPRALSADERLERLEGKLSVLIEKLRRHGVNMTGLDAPAEE